MRQATSWAYCRGKIKNGAVLLWAHIWIRVPSGGLFDGAYGVAGGLEVIRRMKEEGKTLNHSLELYGFNGEESNPLGGTFGSLSCADW